MQLIMCIYVIFLQFSTSGQFRRNYFTRLEGVINFLVIRHFRVRLEGVNENKFSIIEEGVLNMLLLYYTCSQ